MTKQHFLSCLCYFYIIKTCFNTFSEFFEKLQTSHLICLRALGDQITQNSNLNSFYYVIWVLKILTFGAFKIFLKVDFLLSLKIFQGIVPRDTSSGFKY
jgi:hypothetical protein